MSSSSSLTIRQQQIILTIVPKISSSIGMICSTILLYELYKDYYKEQYTLNPIKRSLLFITLYELFDSFGWFVSSWALPYNEIDFIWASGNWITCNIQGFLLQIAIGAPLCSVVLTFLFYIIVKGGWTVSQIILFEYISYSIIFLFCFGTGISFLLLDQYNPTTQTCWIIGYPFGCNESIIGYRPTATVNDTNDNDNDNDTGESCIRGKYSYLYAIFGFYIPLWFCLVSVIGFNIAIRRLLLKPSLLSSPLQVPSPVSPSRIEVQVNQIQNNNNNNNSTHSNTTSNANHSTNTNNIEDAQWISQQALLYSIAFIVTWTPSTVWSIVTWTNTTTTPTTNFFWLDILSATLEPIQGLWNLLIFTRNRPNTIQRLQNYCYYCYCCCSFLCNNKSPSITFDFGLDTIHNNNRSTNNSSIHTSAHNNNNTAHNSNTNISSSSQSSLSPKTITNHQPPNYYLQTTSDCIDTIQKEIIGTSTGSKRLSYNTSSQHDSIGCFKKNRSSSHSLPSLHNDTDDDDIDDNDDESSVGAVRHNNHSSSVDQKQARITTPSLSSRMIVKRTIPLVTPLRRSGRSSTNTTNSCTIIRKTSSSRRRPIEYYISGNGQVEEISSTGQLSDDDNTDDDANDIAAIDTNHSQIT